MKNTIYLLLFASILFLPACAKKTVQQGSSIGYKIKKIQNKNSWYVIYAERGDTLYKIISKNDNNILADYEKIKIGLSYKIDIFSIKDTSPYIGGVKIAPVGYTGCFQFDDKTNICLEPQKGIYELHGASNLKGIYLTNPKKD